MTIAPEMMMNLHRYESFVFCALDEQTDMDLSSVLIGKVSKDCMCMYSTLTLMFDRCDTTLSRLPKSRIVDVDVNAEVWMCVADRRAPSICRCLRRILDPLSFILYPLSLILIHWNQG
jgi:hypothetical protein